MSEVSIPANRGDTVAGSQPLICSVVLLFNNFDDTDECIQSLIAQTYGNHRIIGVDNGSADDSFAQLRAKWQAQVTFIANDVNLGIAAGYNVGLRAGLAAGAEYVVLCNNDIMVEPTFIEALHATFEREPKAAIVAPIMLYYDRPDIVWFGRTKMQPWLGYAFDELKDHPLADVPHEDSTFISDYVTTCATMLSRSALESVGLLDERFFLGHDDVDWCLRARALGLSCIVLAKGLVRHKVSVSQGLRGSNVLGPTSIYTHAKGAYLIGLKHFRRGYGLPYLASLLLLRVPYNVVLIAQTKRWQSLSAYLRGVKDGLVTYGSSYLAADARVSDAQILPRGMAPMAKSRSRQVA